MNAAEAGLQTRWLLFLLHSSNCARGPNCGFGAHCLVGRALLLHATACANAACAQPRCLGTRQLLLHHAQCVDATCAVCAPARRAVLEQQQAVLAGADSEVGEAEDGLLG